jgi:hypothetical protein
MPQAQRPTIPALLMTVAVVGCNGPDDSARAPSHPSERAASAASPVGSAPSSAGSAPTGSTASAGGTAAAASSSATAAAPPPVTVPEAHCAAAGAPAPVRLGTHVWGLWDLAIDPSAVFAVSQKGWNNPQRVLYRVAKDGSGITDLIKYVNLVEEGHIAVDSAWIYFSAELPGNPPGHGSLLRIPREGGSPETMARRFGWLGGVYGGFAYGVDYDWAGKTEAVVRVPTSGGEVQTLLRRDPRHNGYGTGPYRYGDLVVDRDGVFLADSGEGAITRIAHEGGTPEILASQIITPHRLRTCGKYLFFSPNVEDALVSVPKAGGKVIATETDGAWAIAPDGDRMLVFGRDRRYEPGLIVLEDGGTKAARSALVHLFMSHAVADHQCVYYVRSDPLSVSYFDAIAKP